MPDNPDNILAGLDDLISDDNAQAKQKAPKPAKVTNKQESSDTKSKTTEPVVATPVPVEPKAGVQITYINGRRV